MMEKVLIVDLDSCNGCRICELICSMHSGDRHNSKKSCIKVLSHKETEIHIPVLDMRCDFCGRCADWCPPRALSIVGLEEAISARKGAKLGEIPIARISTVDE